MSASKEKKTKSTPVEPKAQKDTQNKVVEIIESRFRKLAELERRLKVVEERLGLTFSPKSHTNQ